MCGSLQVITLVAFVFKTSIGEQLAMQKIPDIYKNNYCVKN